MSNQKFKTLGELFGHLQTLSKPAEKVSVLQANDSIALRYFLKMIFSDAKWAVPEGPPPYTPDKAVLGYSPSHLIREMRTLYLFLDGGNANLQQLKREKLFTSLLERLHPTEAELLLSAKDKTFSTNYKITKANVKTAFPNLLDSPFIVQYFR